MGERTMKMHEYEITAQIVSGIDNGTVWEGEVTIQEANRKKAILKAEEQIRDTVVQYDVRIDPRIRIVEVNQGANLSQPIREE